MDLTDWAKDEEESHDERYEAETFGAESKKTKYGMVPQELLRLSLCFPKLRSVFK